MHTNERHNAKLLTVLEPGVPINLWVDDNRPAPEDALWALTVAEAVEFLQEHAIADMSLDYCLEGWETGDEVLLWLRDHIGYWPTGTVTAHSSSASGRELIEKLVSDITAHLEALEAADEAF